MSPGALQIDAIPAELRERTKWVVWKTEHRDGQKKPTKVPYNARTGGKADSTKPSTWSTFERALRALASGQYDGIGFVLADEDPYTAWDLDGCRNPDTGEITPEALKIVRDQDSYTEVSPSGTGLRIFVRGQLPPGGRKRGWIEAYDDSRYVTITGRHLEGTPTTIAEREVRLHAMHARVFPHKRVEPKNRTPTQPNDINDLQLVDRARKAKNGSKFDELWSGGLAGHASHSDADSALVWELRFWTGGDSYRMDRLFRSSGLMRDKWDRPYRDGTTYGSRTIASALDATYDVWSPPSPPLRIVELASHAR
jgi:putative DNA primase/helicase